MLHLHYFKKLSLATILSIACYSAESSTITSDSKNITSSTVENIAKRTMILGKADAPVSIVEYASFTCGHCATFHNLVLDKLKENYIDTGKVKFTFREVYFDKFGLAGSLIARCDGNSDFYYSYSGELFEKQREWMKSKNEGELLSRFQAMAMALGQSEEKFRSCLNNDENADSLLAWYHHNADVDGIKATPTFLINGKKHSNMSFEDMSKLIDAELNK